MLKIGLTGCRYSGKTSISKIFRQIGVKVFDADTVLKFILNFRKHTDEKIKFNMMESIYTDGFIDINKITSEKSFEKILDIVEPELFQCWERFQENNKGRIYTIFESSILFERSYQDNFDKIISVYTPIKERTYRCQMANSINPTRAFELLGKEMPELHKNLYSNYTIHNYDYGEDILDQVNSLDEKIMNLFLDKNIK